jgi:L-2-hydroxyglutarate oxidase LhgO
MKSFAMARSTVDIAIVGAGVVGASIARALSARLGRSASILLLEKSDASTIPQHASGRNSGVLHAGFYYTSDSLKSKLTRAGNRFLHEYCADRKLPVNQ